MGQKYSKLRAWKPKKLKCFFFSDQLHFTSQNLPLPHHQQQQPSSTATAQQQQHKSEFYKIAEQFNRQCSKNSELFSGSSSSKQLYNNTSSAAAVNRMSSSATSGQNVNLFNPDFPAKNVGKENFELDVKNDLFPSNNNNDRSEEGCGSGVDASLLVDSDRESCV